MLKGKLFFFILKNLLCNFLVALLGIWLFLLFTQLPSLLSNGYCARSLLEKSLFIFLDSADLLVNFAFLIALLKTLLIMSAHQELLAMQCAGISKKQIVLPLICLAIGCVSFHLVKKQWIDPCLGNYVESKRSFTMSNGLCQPYQLLPLPLKDGSKIFYATFRPPQETVAAENIEIVDVFWILSHNDLWHFQSALLTPTYSLGREPTHFIKTNEQFFWSTQEEPMHFPPIKDDRYLAKFGSKPSSAKYESLTQLLTIVRELSSNHSHYPVYIARLLHRFFISFFPLCLALGVAPSCLNLSPRQPYLPLCALLLGIFFLAESGLKACCLLAESRIAPPEALLLAPFLTLFLLAIYRFVKMN